MTGLEQPHVFSLKGEFAPSDVLAPYISASD